jgi:uncharacterized Zn finger protein
MIKLEETSKVEKEGENEEENDSFAVLDLEKKDFSDSEKKEEENTDETLFEPQNFQINPKYQTKYYSAMNKKLKVHGQKYNLNDYVLLKKDFDNNPNTRKGAFESFWHSETFQIKERISEISVRIESEDKSKNSIVSTSRLKKKK